jgi:DNA-binding Lrp family transcriptional regulator
VELDRLDFSILKVLQQDGRISNRDLARTVSLSPSPSWRRLRALEENGVIDHYAAVVRREAVGLSIMGFAHVTLHDHNSETVEKFDRAIMDADFLSEYLLKIGVVRTVNTSFALKQQKSTTVLPLDHIRLLDP